MTDRYTEGWRACREAAAQIVEEYFAVAYSGCAAKIRALPDPAPAAEPDSATAPGHTDMMVPPETLDAFMEANPLPAEPDARVAEIRARLEAAMAAPWTAHHGPQGGWSVTKGSGSIVICQRTSWANRVEQSRANGEFIAHAPADIAYLLAKLEDRR